MPHFINVDSDKEAFEGFLLKFLTFNSVENSLKVRNNNINPP